MSDVAASVDVGVPARTAYDQWTRVESFPAFMPGVVAVRRLGHRSTHWVTEVAGAHREFDAEIVEQQPGERIAWRSTGGDVRHTGAVTFEPLSAGKTRVTVDMDWEPHGLIEKVGSVIHFDRFQVKADLLRFKQFLEKGGSSDPSDASAAPATGAGRTAAAAGTPGTKALAHDVVDVLRTQHERIKRMLALTAATTGPAKHEQFMQLAELLEGHEKAEQEIVHPVTYSIEDGNRTSAHRIAEERAADQIIARMKHTSTNSPVFDSLFEELRDAVLMHAEQEEVEEFPMLRQHVAPERLREMGDEVLEAQGWRE